MDEELFFQECYLKKEWLPCLSEAKRLQQQIFELIHMLVVVDMVMEQKTQNIKKIEI
jgi:hypothetical protein